MIGIIKQLLLLNVLIFSALVQGAVNVKSSAPATYTVKDGDTLWDIAGLYLDEPWLWPELWRNNTYIENPHLIYPGDNIRLVYNAQGEPELVLNSAIDSGKREIRLQPGTRKVLKQGRAIPLLSWSLIQSHIEKDLVMSVEEYEDLPHLLGDQQGGVRYANGDIVLGKQGEMENQNLLVVRRQESILNADGEELGIKVRHVADAELLDAPMNSEILVNVTKANFEVKRGDKLLSTQQVELQQDTKFEAATDQMGRIVGSLQQHSLLGKYDVVILDLGLDQVNQGTVMGIYMQGPDIIDAEPPSYYDADDQIVDSTLWENVIRQPALKVGELVVFKVFDKTSFGLISSSTQIVRQGAFVAKP